MKTNTDQYTIIDLANQFVRALREADAVTRNQAYQVIANRANDSGYSVAAEPFSGLAVAMQAYERRLALDTQDADVELTDCVNAYECQECSAEVTLFIGPPTKRQENDFLVQCVDCGNVDSLGGVGFDDSDHAVRRAESGYAQ